MSCVIALANRGLWQCYQTNISADIES